MSIDNQEDMEVVSDVSDTDSGSESGQMEGPRGSRARGRGVSNDGLEELGNDSDTETQDHEYSREEEEVLGEEEESAGSNMEIDEDGDGENNDATAATQPDSPDSPFSAAGHESRNGRSSLKLQMASSPNAPGTGAGTGARGVCNSCSDVSEQNRETDDANGAKVRALPNARSTCSSFARNHAAASPSGARRPSPPRRKGQGSGDFLHKGARPSSPAELAASPAMSSQKPSLSKVSAASDGRGWVKKTSEGGARAVVRSGKDDGSGKEASLQSQSFLALGVPPDRRALPQTTTNKGPSNGEMREARESSRGQGSVAEDRGEDGEEEEEEGEGNKSHAGVNKLSSTQELLEAEDLSQPERLRSQQQRDDDRMVQRLVNRALSTPGASMAQARARQHGTTSPGSAEIPQGSSDGVFEFDDCEDSDYGRVVQSPGKRSTGSSQGRGQKKVANGKAASYPSTGSNAAGNRKGDHTDSRVRVHVRAPATVAATVAAEEHGRPNPSDARPDRSPESCPQLKRATAAVRQSHMSSGSGCDSGRDDDGAGEEENAADVPVGAENVNTSTTTDQNRDDASTPSRLSVAGAPAPAIAEPPPAPANRPTRRRASARAAGTGAAAMSSSLQGAGAADAVFQGTIAWRVLWEFLKNQEGWSFAKGKGLIDFTYTMPAQEGRPSMTFTAPDDVCAYVRRNDDLFARFCAVEARENSEGNGAGHSKSDATTKRNISKAKVTRSGAGAGMSIGASNEPESDTDGARGDTPQGGDGASGSHAGEGNAGQPNGSGAEGEASSTAETRPPDSSKPIKQRELSKTRLNVSRTSREIEVSATVASGGSSATGNKRGPNGVKQDSRRDPPAAAAAARRGPERPRNKHPCRLSTKRPTNGQQTKSIKKRRGPPEEARQSEVGAGSTYYEDGERGREEAVDDYNLRQSDSDDDVDRPIQGQHEWQSALNMAQPQGKNIAAVAIKANVASPSTPARASPFPPVGDDRSGEDRGNDSPPRTHSAESGAGSAGNRRVMADGGSRCDDRQRPLRGVGVIITGCDKKYRRIVAELGGTEIIFPSKAGANFQYYFPEVDGKIHPGNVLAVANPGSYRKSKYMFAVAARIDIVHPLYLDHIQGACAAADTTNYLLPVGRSALSDRSLIMPHSPTFGPRGHSGSVGGASDNGPFHGKKVLVHGDGGYSPSWDLILWVAGACVTTIDTKGRCFGGLPSDWAPVADGDNVEYVSNCLRKGRFDYLISLYESGAEQSEQTLVAAACETGVTLGSMEWAAQCIAHGRILAPLALFCPWFPLKTAALNGANNGMGSNMEQCNTAAGEGTGSGAVGPERFFCLTRGGVRYVAGDYVLVNRPGAAQAIVRVESFERTNNRMVAVVSKLESRQGKMLSQVPVEGVGKTQVHENWLGRKVLVVDQTSDLASRLYYNDPAVFFFCYTEAHK